MYIQYHASKELGIDKRNILLYAICILYILSTVLFIVDTTGIVTQVSKTCIHNNNFYVNIAQRLTSLSPSKSNLFRLQVLYNTSTTANALCDFISQGILVGLNRYLYLFLCQFWKIYRCWVIWGRNIRVIIIPSILSLAFLGQSINHVPISSRL